jgi:hypothetical protein
MEGTIKVTAQKKSEPKGYIQLTLKFHKEGRNWIGECQELGTSTYHRSLYQLQKELEELVCLHLDTLEDVGEAQRFFKDNGIEFHRVKPKMGTIEIPYNDKVNTFFSSYLQKIPTSPC